MKGLNTYEGMKCRKGYTVELLHSPAGYYLGTRDEDGCPNCRISIGYAKNADLAKCLIPDRVCEENMFCNGYKGCGLSKED